MSEQAYRGEGQKPPERRIHVDTPEAYYTALGEVVQKHAGYAQYGLNQYDQALDRINPADDKARSDFNYATNSLGNTVHAGVQATADDTDSIIEQIELVFADGVAALRKYGIYSVIEEYGVDSWRVNSAMTNVSSSKVKAAMNAALDRERWQTVKELTEEYGVDSWRVNSAMTNVSSSKVKAAMNAALDRERWLRVKGAIAEHGVDSWRVNEAMTNVSSSKVKAAMNAALDRERWLRVKGAIAEHGVDSWRSNDVIRNVMTNVSSSKAKKLITGLEVTPHVRKENRRTSEQNTSGQGSYERSFTADDLFSSFFKTTGSARENSQRRAHHHQKRRAEPTPPRPENAKVVDQRIAVLRGKDTSSTDLSPYTVILKNLDHHRANGRTDYDIYKLLAKHFHQNGANPSEEVMKVLTAAYDKTNKRFIV